jgi:uncharacterized damage-inducible protein DinB
MKTLKCFVLLAAASTAAFAQNPLSIGQKVYYGAVAHNVLAAAEQMPEENYSFKATPDVRSFGQIVGHTADAQYLFCSTVAGEKPPASDIEKTKTSKADLVQAEKDAIAYCDKVYGAMTDDQAPALVKFGGRDWAKLTILTINTAHLDEHYGNIVTYMRLKGLVPPSSAPRKAPVSATKQ